MRLKSPSLNQVPPEWLEDPALVKILESASFHEERKVGVAWCCMARTCAKPLYPPPTTHHLERC